MPKIANEITKQLQIETHKGEDFTVGGILGLKCDYRRDKPCYYIQWSVQCGKSYKKKRFYFGNVSLKEAKEQAREVRKLIDKGIDPNEIKRAQEAKIQAIEEEKRKQVEISLNTLRYVSKACFDDYQSKGIWKGKDKGQHEINRFNNAILPELGNTPITEITSSTLYEHFKKYWITTPNQADKVHNRLNLVFNWAIAKGTFHIDRNPADKKGPFGILIKPLTMARPEGGHHPAPDYHRINELLRECIQYQSISARACIFQILTATRGEAVYTLKWSDIDFDNALIIIRPENDKGSKEFNDPNRPREIYLSRQAIALLQKIPRISEYVFVSRQGHKDHIKDGATKEFLRGIHEAKIKIDGIGWVDPNNTDSEGKPRVIVPHGTSRSPFRTWIEETGKNGAAAELCMFHGKGDVYKGAYRRGKLEKERRQIMQEWADFCTKDINLSEYL